MNNFKPGDKAVAVETIDNLDGVVYLTAGRVYTIRHLGRIDKTDFVSVLCDNGRVGTFFPSRFTMKSISTEVPGVGEVTLTLRQK